MPASGFALRLIGGFELRYEGRLVRTAPAAQRLLAFVATRTTKASRAAVAQTLWPDATEVRAAANLRSTLWRLRRGRGDGPVVTTCCGLELGPKTTVDVHTVQALAEGLARGSAGEPADVDPGMLKDDVLPEWDEPWLVSVREWFRQMRLHALEALCGRHYGEGRFGEAVELGLTAVACEPLRESAHRAVARAHLAEGNPAEALRQYRLYRRLLDEELGLIPSVQFEELIADLRTPGCVRSVDTADL